MEVEFYQRAPRKTAPEPAGQRGLFVLYYTNCPGTRAVVHSSSTNVRKLYGSARVVGLPGKGIATLKYWGALARAWTAYTSDDMSRVELTPEENLRLLEEIEANRAFILLVYQSNPELLMMADPQIRRLFENPPSSESDTW